MVLRLVLVITFKIGKIMTKLSIKTTILTTALVSILFTGCSSKTYTFGAGYTSAMKRDTKIALISDSCIFHDEVGEDNDYLSIYKSKKSTTLLNNVVKEKFNKNGLHVNYLENRIICGSSEKPSTDIKIKIDENSSIQRASIPYFYQEIADKKYKKALKNILVNAHKTALKQKNFEEFFFLDKSIKKSLKIIKDKSQQNKLLVLINNGTEVSAGKSIGQAVLSTIMTFGILSSRNVDFIDSYAVLIDLEEKKVLWRSSVRLKKTSLFDFDKEWYEDEYYNKVLKPLVDNLK